MLAYDFICESPVEIPFQARDDLEISIINGLGGSFSEMFFAFQEKLPDTSSVLDQYWSRPKLAIKKGSREWLHHLVLQNGEENLFFPLQPSFVDKAGDFFDEDHAMLPMAWREVYRWFNSFCLTNDGFCEVNWIGTPFRYSGRIGLDDPVLEISERDITLIESSFGCDRRNIQCWLITKENDLLFIDDSSTHGDVYQLKNSLDMPETIFKIADPDKFLDSYLADYLTP